MTSRAIIPTLVGVLLLAGCSTPTALVDAPDEEPGAPVPSVVCLQLSEGAVASLQNHMQDGITIIDTAAIAAPTEDGYWFVVGRFTGAGIEDGQDAIWGTHNDPTAEGENAYNSIDAMAGSFSDYLTPDFAAGTLPGEHEVKDCLAP